MFPCTASNIKEGFVLGVRAEYAPVIDPFSVQRMHMQIWVRRSSVKQIIFYIFSYNSHSRGKCSSLLDNIIFRMDENRICNSHSANHRLQSLYKMEDILCNKSIPKTAKLLSPSCSITPSFLLVPHTNTSTFNFLLTIANALKSPYGTT